VILKLLCIADLAPPGREKDQFLEQRAWTGFAQKKPFMLIPCLIVYAGQNHHPKTSLTLSSRSNTKPLFPSKDPLLQGWKSVNIKIGFALPDFYFLKRRSA